MKIKPLLYVTLIASAIVLAAPEGIAQGNRPEAPGRPEVPSALAAKIQAHRQVQEALLAERQAFAEALKALPVDERRAAIEAFQAEHADRLAAHRALGDEIRRAMRELNGAEDRSVPGERPDTPAANRPDRSAEVQELTQMFHAEREVLLQRKRELMANHKNASAEQRREAKEQWEEEKAAIIAEIRKLAKTQQQEIADQLENRRNAR